MNQRKPTDAKADLTKSADDDLGKLAEFVDGGADGHDTLVSFPDLVEISCEHTSTIVPTSHSTIRPQARCRSNAKTDSKKKTHKKASKGQQQTVSQRSSKKTRTSSDQKQASSKALINDAVMAELDAAIRQDHAEKAKSSHRSYEQ